MYAHTMQCNTWNSITTFHSDLGVEFMNKHVVEFLECNNIHHQLTIAYTPKQSSMVERDNHIILETTHNMLH
jgi:transposase InsO family protein